MGTFSQRTFERTLEGVEEAARWYRRKQISPRKGSHNRLEKICEYIQQLLQERNGLVPEAWIDRWFNPTTYFALADGIGFGSIAHEFDKVPHNHLPKKKLRETLSGPLDPRSEAPGTGNVNSRNILFELEVAATFSEHGFKPLGFEDFKFRFEQIDYYVECKRLLGRSNIQKNIESATAQLSKRMLDGRDQGIIALALEKLDPGDKPFRASSPTQIDQHAAVRQERFRQGHLAKLSLVDPRIVALLLRDKFFVHYTPDNVIGMASMTGFVSLALPQAFQASEDARLKRLAEHLQRHLPTH